jgi:hypothetical protein
MLRMQYLYHMARHVLTSGRNDENLDPKLLVPAGELAALHCLNLRECLVGDLELLMSASSHQKVSETLEQVSVVVHTACCLCERESGLFPLPESVGSLWVRVAER